MVNISATTDSHGLPGISYDIILPFGHVALKSMQVQ